MYIEKRLADWDAYFRRLILLKESMIPRNHSEKAAVEEIFLTYLKQITYDDVLARIIAFSNQYLLDYYRKMLNSHRWSERMNALYRISDFEISELLNDCIQLKKRDLTNEEFFQLLVIYAKLDSQLFLQTILETKRQFSDRDYRMILSTMPMNILEKFTQRMEQFQSPFRYALIDALGMKRDVTVISYLESLLTHEDTEIRIRSLKAIDEIGWVTHLEQYLAFMDSPIWEERLMLAKLLRYRPLTETLPYLEELIEDESWWVRSQAAQSIQETASGTEVLKQIVEHSSDPYAVDIANELIQRSIS